MEKLTRFCYEKSTDSTNFNLKFSLTERWVGDHGYTSFIEGCRRWHGERQRRHQLTTITVQVERQPSTIRRFLNTEAISQCYWGRLGSVRWTIESLPASTRTRHSRRPSSPHPIVAERFPRFLPSSLPHAVPNLKIRTLCWIAGTRNWVTAMLSQKSWEIPHRCQFKAHLVPTRKTYDRACTAKFSAKLWTKCMKSSFI